MHKNSKKEKYSFFRMKQSRHKNFAEAKKEVDRLGTFNHCFYFYNWRLRMEKIRTIKLLKKVAKLFFEIENM